MSREDRTDNWQQYLDVMCFPTLYLTGKFGKYHPRKVKITHSEFDDSRLLVSEKILSMCLLWQKEMRELSAGGYNLLKQSCRNQHMTVGTLLRLIISISKQIHARCSSLYVVLNSLNTQHLCPTNLVSNFTVSFKGYWWKGGAVDQFYWKKEYQARSAPHYHVLLWIKDAPVICQDNPDEVIQDSTTS